MKKFTRLNSYGAIVLLLFIAITSLVSITSDLPLVPSLPHQQTSYCSTDKEWPHLCCHLVNNCGSHQIFRSSERAGPSPSKTDPSPGGSGTDPTNTWLLGPTQVHTTNSISTGSAVFVWLMVMSNRYTHTDHRMRVTTLCMQCGLMALQLKLLHHARLFSCELLSQKYTLNEFRHNNNVFAHLLLKS